MAYSGKLRGAATATTNPDPSTLTTVNPYPSPYVDNHTASSPWTTQAATYSNGFVPRAGLDGRGSRPVRFAFIPSGGNSVTYTVKLWEYAKEFGKWVNPVQNGIFNLTGGQSLLLPDLTDNPYFFQLSSISSGTIDIWFDNGLAWLL